MHQLANGLSHYTPVQCFVLTIVVALVQDFATIRSILRYVTHKPSQSRMVSFAAIGARPQDRQRSLGGTAARMTRGARGRMTPTRPAQRDAGCGFSSKDGGHNNET